MCSFVNIDSTMPLVPVISQCFEEEGFSIPLLHVLWWIHVYKCRLVFRGFFPTSRQFRESGASSLLFIDQFESIKISYGFFES
jgi:hypothetical protein